MAIRGGGRASWQAPAPDQIGREGSGWRRRGGACAVFIIGVVVAVAGCGSAGEAAKSPTQILADSLSAYRAAHSYRLTGQFAAQERTYQLDLEVDKPNSVAGIVEVGGQSVRILQTGKNTFLQGEGYIRSLAGPQVAAEVGQKWVLYTDADLALALAQLASVSGVWQGLAGTQSVNLDNGGVTDVNGVRVVKLANRHVAFYVRADAPHYPVRVTATPMPGTVGLGSFSLDFSQYNQPFTIVAPATYVNFQNPRTLPPQFVATSGSFGPECGNYGCTLSATVTNQGGAGAGAVVFHLHLPDGTEIAHCRAPIQPLAFHRSRTVACWAYSANFQSYVDSSNLARFFVTVQILGGA